LNGQADRKVSSRMLHRLIHLSIGMFAALVALGFLGWQAWHWLSIQLVDVKPLEKGVLVEKLPAVAVLVKNETPLKAPLTGKVEMLAADGDRLRVGSPVARIQGPQGSATVYSPKPGVLCTHLDGLEGTLRPQNTNVLDVNMIEKIEVSGEKGPGNIQNAEKGVPFCKLVDNLEPVVVFLRVNGEEFEGLERRDSYDLFINGKEVKGRFLELRGSVPGQLLLEIAQCPGEVLHLRRVKAEILTRKLEGYTVSQDALVFEDNQSGIFVVEKQLVKWLPVEITGHMNGKVVLQGTGLNENTRYITNPERVKKGARVEW